MRVAVLPVASDGRAASGPHLPGVVRPFPAFVGDIPVLEFRAGSKGLLGEGLGHRIFRRAQVLGEQGRSYLSGWGEVVDEIASDVYGAFRARLSTNCRPTWQSVVVRRRAGRRPIRPQGPKPEAWEQQSQESAAAFAAFQVYRDTEPSERSIRSVAVELRKSDTLLSRWSARDSWQSRVRFFDAANDRRRLQAQQKERVQMTLRQTRQAQQLQARALEALQLVEPDVLTTTDIVRWLETGMKVERLTLGEPSTDDAGKSAYLALWQRLGGPEFAAEVEEARGR